MKNDRNAAQAIMFIPASEPVSKWLRDLKVGDEEAAFQLWNRYFEKLINMAARYVRKYNCPEGMVVPEDIAASVFESVWDAANAGRFDNVHDRDALWWLLQAMTCRKVINHIRHETAQRRFPGHPPLPLSSGGFDDSDRGLVATDPDAEYIAMMKEQYSHLLSLLRDEKLRRIAVLKVEGFSNEEILEQVQISSATLTRKLKLIRTTWQQALADQGSRDGV